MLFNQLRDVENVFIHQQQRVAAKDCPQDPGRRGQAQHHPEAQFTDGTTTRNTGQEDTHLDGVNDPPRPVEDGPALWEAAFTDGIGIEQHARQIHQQHADGVGEVVHDEAGAADDKHPAQHQEAQIATHVAGDLDPFLQAAGHANGVQYDPAGNDDCVELQRMRNTEQILHALGYQRSGQTEAGTHREDQRHQIEVIDDGAEQPFRMLLAH